MPAPDQRPRSSYDETFVATAASAAVARGALRGFLLLDGVPPERVDAAVGAAGEAIANTIEHAYGQAAGTFRVRAATFDDRVHVEIEDDGRWQASTSSTLSDAADGLTHLSERGRGLFLLRSLSAEASIERSASGTRVRFSVPR